MIIIIIYYYYEPTSRFELFIIVKWRRVREWVEVGPKIALYHLVHRQLQLHQSFHIPSIYQIFSILPSISFLKKKKQKHKSFWFWLVGHLVPPRTMCMWTNTLNRSWHGRPCCRTLPSIRHHLNPPYYNCIIFFSGKVIFPPNISFPLHLLFFIFYFFLKIPLERN